MSDIFKIFLHDGEYGVIDTVTYGYYKGTLEEVSIKIKSLIQMNLEESLNLHKCLEELEDMGNYND